LPECLKHHESGCITIDNKNQYCFKYSIACAEHLRDKQREHPRRHSQYEEYFAEHDYSGMNFPVDYRSMEKFHEKNTDTIVKVWAVQDAKPHMTTKQIHSQMFPWYFRSHEGKESDIPFAFVSSKGSDCEETAQK
jgi:hypothetical protein